MVSKQLESLYMDIQPDAFSMSIVTPKDIVINQPTLCETFCFLFQYTL